jgi:ribokinase
MTLTVPRVPAIGETLIGEDFDLGPGGKGSNQAIGARRLGAEVNFLTCVGPDDFGQAARALWTREGVGIDHVKTGTKRTMVGFILVEPGGENRIAIAPGALNELSASDVQAFAPCIERADLCLTGLEIPLEAVIATLRVARRAGVPTLFNPAPAVPLPDDVWPMVDYLTPNRGEASVLLGGQAESLPIGSLIEGLRRFFDGALVITLGANGAAFSAPGAVTAALSEPATPARVVDTTGAGDAFNSALAVAIADGRPLPEAVAFANAAGAYAVSVLGVIDGLPRREQLAAAQVEQVQ